jgi:hypothetical protein
MINIKRFNPKLIWAGARAIHLALKSQKDFEKCINPVKKQIFLTIYNMSLYAIKMAFGEWLYSRFKKLELEDEMPVESLLATAGVEAEKERFNKTGFKA